MGINLQKGQKIDLTKDSAGLQHIMVGLGWDEASHSGGLFGRFKKPKSIDCDAAAIICGLNGKFRNLVYYANLGLKNGSVIHQGDNLTGEGDGDDEQIMVDLKKLSPDVSKIVFVVNIYNASEKQQHFGMLENAFIRLYDMDKNSEICRFNLSDNYYGMEGLVVGEIYKKENEWKFNAIGQPVETASHIEDLVVMYK